jgi:mRNA-degrading endonuclease toxin of MazEF toxin-antitoxin module
MTLTAPSPASIVKSPAPQRAFAAPELRHKRGEIWQVVSDLNHPAIGTELWSDRPAVIVSNNVLNARSGFAQVVYLSTATRKRSGPTHVALPSADGTREVMALCEQVHTVDASRLRSRMGVVPSSHIRELDAALALSMSIGRNPDTHAAFRKWEEYIKLYGIDLPEEIHALSGLTTDHRVEALTRALKLVTVERDSYRNILQTSQELPAAMRDVAEALDEIVDQG